MVEAGAPVGDAAGEVDLTKVLKTLYRLILARPDKSVFITVSSLWKA